jgi:NAD(P)-dependent dehydrogenase (short-subunit alcohol dehydrogenase family)
MGKSMAGLFVENGAQVVLGDISGAQADVAAALGDAAVGVQCDVSREQDVQRLIATAEDRFGRLDVMCNNAGFGGGMAPLHEQTAENWERVHGTNIRGAFFGIKYAVISMLKSGGGSIVNTTSNAGVVGWKGHSIYGAAKAGVNHMTKSAALDYAGYGIRVNAVAPGTVWTGLNPMSKEFPTPPPEKPRLPGIAIDRWGLAIEIAYAALYFASDESAYVTGTILPVDGGYSTGFSGMGAAVTGRGPSAPLPDI